MNNLDNIRKKFLDFFKNNGHEVVPSSPLVPINDPTLMFVNAGMVPFKNYFTGYQEPKNKRVVSSQKCVRAGGKHNDLDNVGHTPRHHTFFEMLGNFSFGDYFKEEAIEFSWQLLTSEFSLPKDNLLITIHKEDEESSQIWKKVSGFSSDKIISIDTEDNFWSMGTEGPCGPCSEIFYDHGEKIPGGPPGSKEQDGDRFVEIWNLVFMQFLQDQDNKRISLPKPSIDTGMGLERMAAVLQGKTDNFEIDIFLSLIRSIEEEIKIGSSEDNVISFRIIADHLRSTCFLISDGVTPSNDGRGYVLRRIMRRAMRHLHILGVNDPILFKLTKYIVELMGHIYPELNRAQELIKSIIFHEEERFLTTLSKGLKVLESETKILKEGKTLDGSIAFKLYDTYGFPLDLTEDVLKEKSLSLDVDGFSRLMSEQKKKAKESWSGSGDRKVDKLWFDLAEYCSPTEFLGYTNESSMGEVQSIVKEGKIVKSIQKGDKAFLILNQTPFYAESGGQVGDNGIIFSKGVRFEVIDTTKKIGEIFTHFGEVLEGQIAFGDQMNLKIDSSHRKKIKANHSATHLLHESLRRVLGKHVFQKGSKINSEKLRFDFSHSKSVSIEEIKKIEGMVNALILHDSKVEVQILSYDKAIEIGATALFGEKYGEEVRVLSMGEDLFSTELCGGTHVERLSHLKTFKIISQSSVSAGIRRIEAVTGSEALKKPSLTDKWSKSSENLKREKKKPILIKSNVNLKSEIKDIYGINFLFDVLDGVDGKELRSLTDECKKKLGSGISCLVSTYEERSSIAIGVTDDLTKKFDAVEIVNLASKIMEGKGGGGRKDMAIAGAKDVKKINEAIKVIEELIKDKS